MTAPSTDDLGVRLHAADNVVVAAREIPEGTAVGGAPARRAIPRGHKIAVAEIAEGEPVRKYNQIIGFASKPIVPGDHVHTHNVQFRAFERDDVHVHLRSGRQPVSTDRITRPAAVPPASTPASRGPGAWRRAGAPLAPRGSARRTARRRRRAGTSRPSR